MDYSGVEHATVTINPSPVKYGDKVEITVTPDEGYEITDLIVNGESKGAAETADIPRATQKIVIEAETVPKEFDVTVKVGEGGKANIQSGKYTYGTELEIKATPDEGYKFSTVEVDGVVIDGNTVKITKDTEIEITFEKVEAPKEDKDENKDEDNKTENKEEPKKEEPKDKAPATGDINVVLLVSLAVLSLGAVIIAIRKKNKV